MRYQTRQARRRGMVLPLVAMCCVALLGMVALAIDIGRIAVARNQCQNAADAAAMAGARTISGDSSSNYNISAVPGNAVSAAIANKVFAANLQGNADPAQMTVGGTKDANNNAYIYTTGNV